jgi:hypothetical protein
LRSQTRQSSSNGKPRRLSTWEKREFEQLEGKIAQLEAEKAEAEKALYNAPSGSATKVQQLYEQVEALTQAIDAATERWMELAELELADGDVTVEEEDFLNQLYRALEISEEIAVKVIDVMLIKNRG